VKQTGIVHQSPRRNPVMLILVGVIVVPFALSGQTSGIILAVAVWVTVAALLVRWWRTRSDPRPPRHVV
jgi:hypothetical protein